MSEDTPETAAAEPAEEAERKKKFAGSKITPAQWAEIILELEYDTKTAAQIAEEYGVTRAAITDKLERLKKAHKTGGIGSKKRELEEKITKKVIADEALKRAAAAPPPTKSWDEQRKEIARNLKIRLARAAIRHFNEHDKMMDQVTSGAKTAASFLQDFKALRNAGLYVKEIWDVAAKGLDVDTIFDEQELPTILIRDLTKEETDRFQSGNDEEDISLPEDPTADDDVVKEGV